MTEKAFQFEISLSVLNHLGRNLYRNFITVLGEAVSNSWDANAKNVWIDFDRRAGSFTIRDDGEGMDTEGFQGKFLKVGYSKRKELGAASPSTGRPFIGAKGIGKLAMLSCADRISVFSKTEGGEVVGGVIDNGELDQAIKGDLVPDQYPLGQLDMSVVQNLEPKFDHGTLLVFEGVKEEIRNSEAHLKKLLAINFHFCLSGDDFRIHLNGKTVSVSDLSDLLDRTEFCWLLNQFSDPLTAGMKNLKAEAVQVTSSLELEGFLATVEKPRHAKISGTDERASVDLFVNGRLREKNILRHIPTQRLLESYVYGQIHFNSMDEGEIDPFTSSREGVKQDNENFKAVLDYLKRDLIQRILDEWDAMRLERGEEGDDENPRKSKRSRKAAALNTETAKEFAPEEGAPAADTVAGWLKSMQPDAEFNLMAYAECFLAENLLREYIVTESKPQIKGFDQEVNKWRDRENQRKGEANISFSIRVDEQDIAYLGMDWLAKVAEGSHEKPAKSASLHHDSVRYTPIRNAVGHTGRLSVFAKRDLTTTFENIKSRLRVLLAINKK